MKHPRKCRSARTVILLILGATAAAAHAGTCTVSANGLAFGAYQPITFPGKLTSVNVEKSNLTVTISCTGLSAGTGYSVALGPSPVNNSINPRYMAHDKGGPPMVFNVYRDGAYTSIWGDGITGATLSGTLAAGDSTTTVGAYGRVPAGQHTLRAGSYSAVLPMTLTYQP